MLFYRDAVSAAFEADPNTAVEAVTAEVMRFQMPGVGIPGYRRKAAQIAKAGIYDLRIHADEIIWPLLRHWNLFELEGLDAQAEQARAKLGAFMADLDQSAARFETRRAETLAREGG
jgi:acyl-[acyl-carrier-protein] desaturase